MEFEFDNFTSSIIKVFGVGGCGCNALMRMQNSGIYGVDFVALNTDIQSLNSSPVSTKIQLGPELSRGLGSGTKPDVGKNAAIESADEIEKILNQGTGMLIITAGMGKGTGTGSSPEIAKMARDLGILTVAVVTLPFRFEGQHRMQIALEGLEELKNSVDSYVVIENQRVMEIHGDLPSEVAYAKGNENLLMSVKGLSELITIPGTVNVDLADVKTIMSNSGITIMGAGSAEGPNRTQEVIDKALNSDILPKNMDIKQFSKILLNIASVSGEKSVTLGEIENICKVISDELGNTNVTYGQSYDDSLGDSVYLTIIATGFSGEQSGQTPNIGVKNEYATSLSNDNTDQILPIKEILTDEPDSDNETGVSSDNPDFKIPQPKDPGYKSAVKRNNVDLYPTPNPGEKSSNDDRFIKSDKDNISLFSNRLDTKID